MAALSLYRPCRVSFSPWGGQDLTMNFGTRLRCTRRAVSPLTFLFTRISREITSTPVFFLSLSLSFSLSLSPLFPFLFTAIIHYMKCVLLPEGYTRISQGKNIFSESQFSLLRNLILYIWIGLDLMMSIVSRNIIITVIKLMAFL